MKDIPRYFFHYLYLNLLQLKEPLPQLNQQVVDFFLEMPDFEPYSAGCARHLRKKPECSWVTLR